MKNYFQKVSAILRAPLFSAILFCLFLILGQGSALAQFDQFGQTRTVAIAYPTSLTSSGSNFYADLHEFTGIAKIDIGTLTNGACTAAQFQAWTSPDMTNWTVLTNFAVASSNAVIYTNVDIVYQGNVFPGPMLSTNIFMLHGTNSTANAALAGFAGPYISPTALTSGMPISLTANSGANLTTIGFNVDDLQRYIRFGWSFTGNSTNTVWAVATLRK